MLKIVRLQGVLVGEGGTSGLKTGASAADTNSWMDAIRRILYSTMICGIVGSVWWLASLQQQDRDLQLHGLPAPDAAMRAQFAAGR